MNYAVLIYACNKSVFTLNKGNVINDDIDYISLPRIITIE